MLPVYTAMKKLGLSEYIQFDWQIVNQVGVKSVSHSKMTNRFNSLCESLVLLHLHMLLSL